MDAEPREWVLAIDFGTSYSSAALAEGDRVDLVDVHGDRRVPSMVLLADDGELLIGTLAANQAGAAPDRLERTPKARVGRSPVLLLGRQAVPVVDAVGALVAAFVDEARRQRGGAVPATITLTHPVRWGEDRRRVLIEAAASAGIDPANARLVEEPVAAASAFRSERVQPGSVVAVYDLGGGTFDAAVLQATETGFVVAGPPGGDDNVGGETFDERLLAYAGEQIAAVDPEGWEALCSSEERRWRRAHAQLRDQIRMAKETLSVAGQARLYIPGVDRDLLITRAEFERLIVDDVAHTMAIMDDVIAAAGTNPEQLTAVYPVGGSSRIPLVANQLLERYGDRVVTWDDPQAAVALGAARLARHNLRLLDERPSAAAEADVAPPPQAAEPPAALRARRPWPALPRRLADGLRGARRLAIAGGAAAVAAAVIVGVTVTGGGDAETMTATPAPTQTPAPAVTPDPRYALGVTCPEATENDLPETVDRDCLKRWFAAYTDKVDPPGFDDDRSVVDFFRYFDAAFATNMADCIEPGSCPASEKASYSADPAVATVWDTVDYGVALLVSPEGKTLDVAFNAGPGTPDIPDPWAVGDGDAGASRSSGLGGLSDKIDRALGDADHAP